MISARATSGATIRAVRAGERDGHDLMTRTLTAAELAEALGVGPSSIYQAVADGTCPVPPIRVGRRIVFSRTAVDRLLEGGEES